MVYTFMDEQNVKLHPYVKVTDPEGQPVYYTLSDEGVSYIFDLLQKAEVKYTAE
ncbi:MAG: hypothetical protein IKZ19_03090 [Clostridia bacterium]|nr:hypothetical protein [Clostridia bacterium]